MMTPRGVVDIVVRDKDTLQEIYRITQENLVLDVGYLQAILGTYIGSSIVIGSATQPMYRTHTYLNGNTLYTAGYNEPSTASPKWFDADAATETPPYVQFKQRFDPPAAGQTRNITSVYLSWANATDVATLRSQPTYDSFSTNIGAQWWDVYAGFILETPCVQTDTQVLDIFYRIQFAVPEEGVSIIHPTHSLQMAKAFTGISTFGTPTTASSSALVIPPNPSRISAAQMIAGPINFGNEFPEQALPANTYTVAGNAPYFKRSFTWNMDLAAEIGKVFSTHMFGTRLINGMSAAVSANTGQTRIQPVHNHNSSALAPFIDVNTLANGSGSVVATEDVGGWTSITKMPEMFKIDITTTGDVGTSAYKFKVRNHMGFYGNTFLERHETCPFFTDENLLQNYTNQKTHGVSSSSADDRAVSIGQNTILTADNTGITKANLITGEFKSWDSSTIPALPATLISDIYYEKSKDLIWVACKNTGLYTVMASAPFTVTKITTAPAPANVDKCYAIDLGYNNQIWAMFDGALCSTVDGGATWTAYHSASTPSFNLVALLGAYSTVRSMKCDPKSVHNQMLITRTPTSTPNNSNVWWSTGAPDVNVARRYWRVVFCMSTEQTIKKLYNFQFKDGSNNILSTGGTGFSSRSPSPIANAFDATNTMSWETFPSSTQSTLFYIGYDFGSDVNIKNISFKTPSSTATDTAMIATLQHSSDNLNWHTSAYLGTSAGVAQDSRGFSWSINATYNLVPITAWSVQRVGPTSTILSTERNAIIPAFHTTHFITSSNSLDKCTQAYWEFGTQANERTLGRWYASSTDTVGLFTGRMFPTIFKEIDPTTGANVYFFVGNDTNFNNTLIRPRNDIGELLPESFYGRPLSNRGYFSANMSHNWRMLYLGKGMMSYMRSSGAVADAPINYALTIGQVMQSTRIDNGGMAPYVWDSYGWDGAAWVKNHTGSKLTHSTDEALANGIRVRFGNAPSGVSFQAGDHHNFGVCDGVWKDNATTMAGSYSYYYKPTKFNVTSYSTPTVQQIAGFTGTASVLWGTRGVAVDTTNTIPLVSTKGAINFKELLFGDFEISWTLPSTSPSMRVEFGIIPPNMFTGNVTGSQGYTFLGTLGGTSSQLSTNGTTYTATNTLGGGTGYGKILSVKRVGTTISFLINGIVAHTVLNDTRFAYRPFIQLDNLPNSYRALNPVMIVSNGSAYAAYAGNGSDSSGVYDPKFYGVDDQSLSAWKVNLNGTPVVAKYTNYLTTASLGINEVLIDGRSGIVFFNPADAGKTISGSFTQVNNQ